MHKKYLENNPVIVFGLYFPGIEILKTLRIQGIYGIGLDSNNSPGLKLLKIKTFLCPDPNDNEQEWLSFLLKFKDLGGKKPVILNTSDNFIDAILNNSEILSQYFLFHDSINGITQKLMNKSKLVKLAEKLEIPVAKTIHFKNIDQLEVELKSMCFPLLIRPEFGKKWQKGVLKKITNGEKLLKVENRQELIHILNKILPYDKELIIQELVVGPDENLYYLVCYIDKDSNCVGHFCGQKLRLLPAHFGSATYMKTCSSEPLLPYALKLLKENNYHGPAGVEFKLDERDSQYKIIEINTRYGLWDSVGTQLGVNVFKIGYNDLAGIKQKPVHSNNKEVYWWSIIRDLSVIRQYKKEGLLKYTDLFKLVLKRPYIPDFYWNEPLLMLNLYIKKITKLFKFI